MKLIYAVGITVLIVVLVAWRYSELEHKTNTIPNPATSSDVDASPQMGGNVETPQHQESQRPVPSSRDLPAGRDVGSDGAMAADQVASSVPDTGQAALRNTTETTPGQSADTNSSQPSATDKSDCQAAAKTLNESWSIFDVTPTQAVAYAGSRSPYPDATHSGFSELKARLLAPLCSGTSAFNQAYAAQMEFVAISPDSHVRILVGDHWISDGTVLSPMSEADQQILANLISQRRRRTGLNMSRESFERRLAHNPRALIAGP
jgi:hypothetical protein